MNLRKIYLVFFFLLITFIIPSYPIFATETTEANRPFTILVLNSYHYTYPWTFNQNIGITERLNEHYPDAIIYTEFMDWKRNPDESMIDSLTATFAVKYKATPIDLILTTDDKALIYALEHRDDLFSDAPIAFSGIIEFTAKEIIDTQKRVTGVYEQMDPVGALKLLDTLQPGVTDIYLIHDLSESGIRTNDNILLALTSHETTKQYKLTDLSQFSFKDLLKEVSKLPTSSVIFMNSYNISSDGHIEKPEVFGKELSTASSVPIYSIDEFLLGNGITGGTFLSGILQGNQLADLGISILEGTSPDLIPHVSRATVYTAVDEDLLQHFELDKKVLTDDIRIINEHFSFYETYKSTVWISTAILLTLLGFISLLIVNIQKRHHNELELLSQKDELQYLYEQVQSSEEELIAQTEELELYQSQLKKEAHYDALTNLPNRLYLSIYGKDLFSQCKNEETKLVLFFIDLNNFRYINNTHGHAFGDLLLQHIAIRLSDIPESAFTARLAGDEFIVLAEVDAQNFDVSVKKIIISLRQIFLLPYQIKGLSIPITGSIGYSIYPDDGLTIEELIVQADIAMYEAKKEKKSYAKRFDAIYKTKYDDAFIIISRLKDAYENKEFLLHFQPQIDLLTNEIVGFEALMRWNSPEFGFVPPSKFIPLAESSGFIKTLGICVIKNAISFAKDIQSHIKNDFKVSINVSVIQLFEDDFIETIKKILIEEAFNPDLLQFEITESVMIESYDLITERLKAIKDLGITLSLDDFGTGYSSLIYLHHLPISELKIDKIFVDEILLNNDEQHELINTILTLAKASNLCVVAEGVEDKIQVDYLKERGCDRIQGYYYSKPLPLDDIILFCEQHDKAVTLYLDPQ